ncbi:glycosyltransferase [uncultured Alcanivorax sp.]|jgi:glycosyltransferase involved in cell wall biosynthesis|uniref:glycosyltransferase n=1 Tax=uncultured Alcanivorax sp. TaxID=191215 RepID=UPI0032B12574
MILINMISITSGGGLQNSLSFLKRLSLRPDLLADVVVSCVDGGRVHDFCKEKDVRYVAFPAGRIGRIYFELIGSYFVVKKYGVALVFSLFGPPPIGSFGVFSISGFAYSNIIQPEIPFWFFLPWHRRVIKKLKDLIRLKMSLRAERLIVETEYLKERAESGVFVGKNVSVVRMQPSGTLNAGALPDPRLERLKGNKILYLSGDHRNKRIHCLASVFGALADHDDWKLITTLPESSGYLSEIKELFNEAGVPESIVNVGPVDPAEISGIIASCDAMINVSLLESFSNNWVESWFFQKPLIVTDSDWARASCGDAAVYIDVYDFDGAAKKISDAICSDSMIDELNRNACSVLESLYDRGDKNDQYFDIILSDYKRVR